ncbi:MAG: tyrosine-type recombinase/integrase [Acidobacteriota bacterium]|nr:tyrosine-type recombinase/integrase [Acidobacteriota bacterium]
MEEKHVKIENKIDSLAGSKKEFEKSVRPFIEKSLSTETRRAYGRVVREFFLFHKLIEPGQIKPLDVIGWRDSLIENKKSAATVSFKLSVIRSLFEYLKASGFVQNNPALTKLVTPPKLSEDLRGRALTVKEVNYILSGPDKEKPEGARDYAILLTLLRTSLRVAEVCNLKSSSIKWNHGRWTLKFKVKGGRERTIPLPKIVKQSIDDYLELDRDRRKILKTDSGNESWIFQPTTNYRTLVFDKSLSTTMVWYIVRRWGEFTGIGKVSPHDLRRTAITRALDKGLTYRQVQMMSGHKDPKTVMRYDHGRENLEHNAINFIDYDEQ